MARRVVMLLFPDALALDVSGPSEAFSIANQTVGGRPQPYDVRFVSLDGGSVRMSSGMSIDTEPLGRIRFRETDTLIVSGGPGVMEAVCNASLVRRVRSAGKVAGRVCSVCSGAFLLAETGMLDGRNAVTHWASAEEFRSRYPDVKLAVDPIFVEDGHIWTSAGVTAGIDMALALIGRDLGSSVSAEVARHLVVFLQRPGGQAQFSEPLKAQSTDRTRGGPLIRVSTIIAENLSSDLTVTALADKVGMSPRTLARMFERRSDGTTPAKLVESIRLETAVRELTSSTKPTKVIAMACGFGNEERMRRAFIRKFGIAPGTYRSRFQTLAAPSATSRRYCS